MNIVSDKDDVVAKFEIVYKGVGKLKGHRIKLHIDPNVKPIAQPLRKSPYGLSDRVDEQIEELLAEDL